MSRKNMHGKVGVKFKAGWTTAKNNNMLRNVVTELIVNEKVEVTLATAKQLSPLADKMVTFAKKGDLNSRRQAAKIVRDVYADKEETKTALQKLFTEIAERNKDRNGGYTRIIKTGTRRGDDAEMAIVELL